MGRLAVEPGRRAFCGRFALVAFAAANSCFPLATQAQAPKVRRVAVVFWRIPPADLTGHPPAFPGARTLLESLGERGWVSGRNLEVLWRSAEGSEAKRDRILDELVAARVDVIAISGNDLVKAAMARTRSIPIVMLFSVAPVEAGLVDSLARPTGNVTGVLAEDALGLHGKRRALLKQAAPRTKRVALLTDPVDMENDRAARAGELARALGLTLMPYAVGTHKQLEDAVENAVEQGADALFVDASFAAVAKNQPAFHALAERHRLPAMHANGNAVRTGGLMAYGNKPGVVYQRTAYFIDRILRGAKPADMPVEQPAAYTLVLNLTAAKAIGLTLPPALIAQADEVLQ